MRVPATAAVLLLTALPGAAKLPVVDIPPGHTKTFLLIHPHHDDHSWESGPAGLITKLADAGWTGYFVRVSNDEKDGPHGYPHNDIVNLFEAREATENLGIADVISLNWRNDYMDPTPHNEIRGQLILLIRKYRPDVVISYFPWGHYDRNPDHRKVSKAVGEAVWLAGFANVHPEHRRLGFQPHRVPYKFYTQRSDYGKGYVPNAVVELNESNVRRKARSYWLHRNVRLRGATGRRLRQLLKDQGLEIPELANLTDIEAHARMQEWSMYDAARKVGSENGIEYGEMFSHLGEWHPWPGLDDYLQANAVDQ